MKPGKAARPSIAQLSLSLLIVTMPMGLKIPHALAASDSEKLYQLCSSFPYNSQCEGYSAPVALADRPGKPARCVWGMGDAEQGADCKLALEEDGIVAYLEEGDKLSILEDRRSTRSLSLSYDSMEQLQYREFKQGKGGARAVNTLLFGAIGFFATRDKPVSEVTIRYQSDFSAEAAEASAFEAPMLERLSLIFERDLGFSVRTHLESQTNLDVGVPEAELPFVEPTAP